MARCTTPNHTTPWVHPRPAASHVAGVACNGALAAFRGLLRGASAALAELRTMGPFTTPRTSAPSVEPPSTNFQRPSKETP